MKLIIFTVLILCIPHCFCPLRTPNTKNKQRHFRHCLLFLYDKNNLVSAAEAARQLGAVYGEEAPKETACRKWLTRFKDGSKDIDDLDDEERSGRPTEFDEDRLREAIEQDPRFTIRELSILLNSSIGSIHRHLHAIGKV